MRRVTTDIDIDVANRDRVLRDIRHVPALQADRARHPSGVYFQDIPSHPSTGFATLDHRTAAGLGYFKIDLLNNSIYRGVRDEAHLRTLIAAETPWWLFMVPAVVARLQHIHQHFGIVQRVQPSTLDDLAVIVALIRPGQKHLLTQPRAVIDAEIWRPQAGDGYTFKKSHAYAYALSIVVQLNLMLERVESDPV